VLEVWETLTPLNRDYCSDPTIPINSSVITGSFATSGETPTGRTASSGYPPLPDNPVVTIEPTKSWAALRLGDLWQYRELLYFLIWRDVKVRYKQTLLGAAWAILQPLMTMIIFTLLFGRLAGIPSDGIPYPIFAYAGLLIWTFFANAVSNSANSLVGSANLITKIYFPRMIIPSSAVGAGLVDLAIAFLLLIALMVYYRVPFRLTSLMIVPLVALSSLLALGVGMWLSALNVKYRDIRYAIPFLIQLGMFISPVIYPLSMVPPGWRWALSLNPLTGIIENFRVALFGGRFTWNTLAVSTAITLFFLIASAYSFRRMEKTFADVV
jgi:lipopolysaccharide transport system permease protein